LYPAMRDIASLGDAEVEQAKKEHQLVTNDLYELDQLLPNAKDGRAIPKMDELCAKVSDRETRTCSASMGSTHSISSLLSSSQIMKDLLEHVQDEETRLLPLFVKDCDPSKARDILSAYQNAIVTTRPHVRRKQNRKSARTDSVVGGFVRRDADPLLHTL
jgi:hypothetical protein